MILLFIKNSKKHKGIRANKTKASKKLERIVSDIAKLEQELADLRKEKDKLEIDVNTEITESLKI